MANHGEWPNNLERKLKKHWLKAKGDRDKFQELVLADKALIKEKKWDACERKARRKGYFKEAKPSKRYAFSQLGEEKLEELKRMLADDNISWSEIEQKLPGFTKNQFRNFAKPHRININKGRPGRKAVPVPEATKEEELTEQKLIEKRESGNISVEDFLESLKTVKGEYPGYWNVIRETAERQRTFRVRDLLSHAKKLNATQKKEKHKLNFIGGIVRKFQEWGVLFPFKTGTHYSYACNLPDFYKPEELLNLVPGKEISRIIRPLADGPKTLEAIEQEVGGNVGVNILKTVLDHLVSKGVVVAVSKPMGAFKLTEAAKLTGTDPSSLLALDLFKAENLLDQEEDREAQKVDAKDTKTLAELVRKDLASKTIVPRIVEVKGDSARFFVVGEARLGNQFTDFDLLHFAEEEMKRARPDIVVASGFVQGDHRSYQVERLRALTKVALLHKVASQYRNADRFLRSYEESAGSVFYLQGDDDMNIAKSRTLIAMKELLGLRRTGMGALFPEEIARLSGRDYVGYLEKQWEYVQTYMWRIGRSLLNKDEVNAIVPGLNKSEFLLILMILLFRKFGHEIPESFAKVVDIEALFGDKAGSKRHVTPDPLLLKLVFGKDTENARLLQFIHNAAYSDITQYLDSLIIMEKSFRQLQARGVETPNFVFDFQQERFFGTNVGGSLIFNLPGCQNTVLAASRRLKTFNTQIVGEKSHKQNTFRKEPVSPGIADFEVFKDGRFKFRVLNNATRQILENSRTVPEVKERLALFQDIQVGSPQMRLEWAIKAHDLALYGPNPVDHVSYNGDILHGVSIYPQFISESRIKKLVSIKSQQAMAGKFIFPFYPAPTVKHIGRVLGNHEWDNRMTKYEGGDPLSFLETGLTARYDSYNEGYKRALIDGGFKGEIEVPYKDIEIIPYSRGRTSKSGNPEGGGTVHWPFYTKTIGGGFTYAVQHKWQPFGGGGRTPVDSQIRWMTNMAKAARGINVMFGGHWHSFWVAMVADILMLQMPGLIDQSGLELGFGLTPLSLFCMAEFSNKDGITVEMYPMEYLVEYQCVSPFYKGKNELLVRPKPGSREYEYGFDSPLIHQWEDEVDSRHIAI